MIIPLIKHLEDGLKLPLYPLVVPENGVYPCLVYHQISQNDRISVNAKAYQSDFLIQLDLYASTYKETQILKEKIKSSLYDFHRPLVSIDITENKDDEKIRAMFEVKYFV